MSLRGRYVIDRIKRVVSSHLKLPVPPYGEPRFWEHVYQKMETASSPMEFDDSFEWGGVGLTDLLQYDYRKVTIGPLGEDGEYASSSQVEDSLVSTTWGETLGVDSGGDDKEPILMLGCGNSKLGEEMVDHGWRGPIVQLDVAKQALEMIARRSEQQKDRLQFVEDDATRLSTVRDTTIQATIDKGLLDAFFCADEYHQMTEVLGSVLRVLQPGGVFCIFSRSRPEFFLPKLMPLHSALVQPGKPTWQGLQMQELDQHSMLLYRFEKSRQVVQEPKRIKRKRQ